MNQSEAKLYICDEQGEGAMPVKGYGIPGLYKIERVQDGQVWPYHVRYTPASAAKSTVVLYPGYRMRGAQGYICGQVSDFLGQNGYSTLVLDYGGLSCNKSEKPDDATMTTNIEDARAAVEFLKGQPRIDLCISYGVNVAIPQMDQSCLGVVGIVPTPDYIQKLIKPEIDEKKLMDRGYVRHRGTHPEAVKYTKALIEDAQNHSVFDPEMANWPNKAAIRLVVAEKDEVVPLEVLTEWEEHLLISGYDLSARLVPDSCHHKPDARFLMQALTEIQHLCAPGVFKRPAYALEHNRLAM